VRKRIRREWKALGSCIQSFLSLKRKSQGKNIKKMAPAGGGGGGGE
jgi:hypothetical protein